MEPLGEYAMKNTLDFSELTCKIKMYFSEKYLAKNVAVTLGDEAYL